MEGRQHLFSLPANSVVQPTMPHLTPVCNLVHGMDPRFHDLDTDSDLLYFLAQTIRWSQVGDISKSLPCSAVTIF